MKRLLFIVLTLFFACCSGVKTESNPAKLLGRTLRFPENHQWSIMGRDTTNSIRATTKIVVYYNAEGCRSCRMKQLSNWKDLLKDLDALKMKDSLDVELVFIVHAATDDEVLIKSIQERKFDIPILCDEAGEFERHNVLPEDILYHAFLLNKNNQILLIGAPIFSPKIWSKYKAKIGELSRQ